MTTISHSMSALRPVAAAAAGAVAAAGAGADGEAVTGGSCDAAGVGAAAFAGAAGAAAAAFGAVSAGFASAAPSASTIATTLPSDNLSPTFTFKSTILPATDDGTSIVALSDSSVTRPWSIFTVSPTATSNSMTGTS